MKHAKALCRVTVTVLALTSVGLAVGCVPEDKVNEQVEAVGRTPPFTPDGDSQLQECLAGSGVRSDDGRIHNRFLWCRQHAIGASSTFIDPETGRGILVGEIVMEFTAVAYGRDDGQRGIRIFIRGDSLQPLIPAGTFQPASLLTLGVRCPSGGCQVIEPDVTKPFEAWMNTWTSFTIESDPASGEGNEQVSYHSWKFEFHGVDDEGSVGSTEDVEGVPAIRCDSAQYFRTRNAACVFWDVVPHLQYSLQDARKREAVEHIQCNFFPFSAPNCLPNYPITPDIKVLPGRYQGNTRDELLAPSLHRIPSAGMVLGDTRAAANRDEAVRACSRVGRYQNPGGQYPGLPATDYPQPGKDCDEYPFASTSEGSARFGSGATATLLPLFSVKAIGASPNRCAGSALGRYYLGDRILYKNDPFYVEILDAPVSVDVCDDSLTEDELVAAGAEEVPSTGGGGGGGGGPVDGQPISVDAGIDVSGAEGTRVLLAGFADHASTLEWSYEAVSAVAAGAAGAACTFSAPHSAVTMFSCTDNGTYRVTLTASNDVEQKSDSAIVTLRNLPPRLTLSGPTQWQVFRAGTQVDLLASFTDPGSNDTHTCTVDWDDGTSEATAGTDGNCNRSHSFPHPGMYTIDLAVSDDDGGSDRRTVLVVVYDPDAGFVTAGGFIDSPAGALHSAPDATGKGHFQFNPKYHKGDQGPQPSGGKFSFSLQGASFDVDSIDLEWLVVTPDNKAALKGTASVGGQSGFGFVAYAYDDPDQFRLIVWPLTDGNIPPAAPLYDSHRGAQLDLDLAKPLATSGGSIQIHH